ncbi:hypothetical protein AcW1_005386 [Taiwanofungus camphoratus]|nr:hypothetical protein AcW2_004152 [Antrodia cinnamomea]KAI0933600.1 hypothetical protein AcV5_005704 [Antrodia cinnamomea]KAI0956790.1 hypothetical protein AcW1_005386 [Antrodia cinnamomea]
MDFLSHPRPSVPPPRQCPRQLRQLVPQGPPPTIQAAPPLPSPSRRSLLDASFVLTTHFVPAALPRTVPDVPLPALPAWSADRQQWKASVTGTADAMVSMRYKQWNGELKQEGGRKPLWACVNRYVRKDLREGKDGQGLTLFLAHANGFPKEIWECALLHLATATQSSNSTCKIDEIWVWEAVNHGDACLVNADNLSGIYDWQDNSRDILHFLLYYLPPSASPAALPVNLPRLPDSASESRESQGFEARTLVAIGHSLGGCTSARAAIVQPRLFSSLILVDPIIRPYPQNGPLIAKRVHKMIVGAVQRQTRWSSREEALEKFRATPFFAAWDPAVLELYVECGLCDDPSGGVKLKMPGIHEALVFSETLTPYETWDLLDTLDERIELRWIVPGQVDPEESGVRESMVWRRPENSSNIIIPNAGHLIAQEAPSDLAQAIFTFLERKYGYPQARL